MDDLIAFIRARLDEDEAVARRNIGDGGLADTEDGGPGYPDYQTYDGPDIAAACDYRTSAAAAAALATRIMRSEMSRRPGGAAPSANSAPNSAATPNTVRNGSHKSMDELIAFITARLDEGEAAAKESADLARTAGWVTDDEIDGWNIGAHPMRDLRDIAAKRAILAAYAEVAYMDIADPEPEFAYGRAAGLGEAVRQIGTEFSTYPGYLDDWKP